MTALFTVTIFVGATLLFLVQPMFARLVLPLLGGAPAVWNTAMVFFQATLLLGYAYAHASTARLGPRRQATWHLALLIAPLAVLPVALPAGWTPPVESNPIAWLLGVMALSVGLPFLVLATMSPVLQKWFSATGHQHAADPYFLYAASNAGSIFALLAYPLALEPRLTLAQQTHVWAWGYGGFILLAAACATCVWRTHPSVAQSSASAVAAPLSEKPSFRRRARWVLLAFVPSSLMLGVTAYLSSEVAVVPLLWIVPLALYLLSFIFAFARNFPLAQGITARAFPILLVALVVALNLQATEPLGWLMLLHLAVFFLVALLCHGRLAADRPAADRLTEFYLWLSVGGALGGIFNALLAPLLFNGVAEYPLALVLAALLATASGEREKSPFSPGDWLWPLGLGAFAVALVLAFEASRFSAVAGAAGLVFGVPALVCFFFSRRPVRFALGIGALFLSGLLHSGEKGRVLYAERSFFGVHRVTLDPTGRFHLLVHGKTLHGTQALEPARRREPLAYYHRTGPAGDVLAAFARDPARRVGVVGLGVGSLASFALPRQAWTYFEIDPVVARLARDDRFFTFLRDSPGAVQVILGDARVSLAATPAVFDVLVLDAFSSDAIPVHLVTREALALYLERLAPHGVLAFHISNLHLDLEPILGTLARTHGLAALVRDDTVLAPEEIHQGKAPSIWAAVARTPGDLAPLARDPRWRTARTDTSATWTDDYSSLLRIFRWR